MNGVELISAERQRQIAAEGWTAKHDDGHCAGELARAAACYAMPPFWRVASIRELLWPWHEKWWKPTASDRIRPEPNGRIRELVKAGALIAAEIDRLQREPTSEATPSVPLPSSA